MNNPLINSENIFIHNFINILTNHLSRIKLEATKASKSTFPQSLLILTTNNILYLNENHLIYFQ